MNIQQPFVKPDIADRIVSEDDAGTRHRGALVVALQLDNSAAFASLAVWSSIIGGGLALWLHSWTPVLVVVAFLAFMFYKLIFATSREVSRTGILPEYQAAYKRLYYSDASFKKQVDDLRANQK